MANVARSLSKPMISFSPRPFCTVSVCQTSYGVSKDRFFTPSRADEVKQWSSMSTMSKTSTGTRKLSPASFSQRSERAFSVPSSKLTANSTRAALRSTTSRILSERPCYIFWSEGSYTITAVFVLFTPTHSAHHALPTTLDATVDADASP